MKPAIRLQASASPVRLGFHRRGRCKPVTRVAASLLLSTLCLIFARPAHAQTFGCNPPMANDIVCENSKPGNPSSDWDVSGAGDLTIQGFATDISVNQGQTIFFKIKHGRGGLHHPDLSHRVLRREWRTQDSHLCPFRDASPDATCLHYGQHNALGRLWQMGCLCVLASSS